LVAIYFFVFVFFLFAADGLTFYVDSTVKNTHQTGTESSPFSSVAQAVDAGYKAKRGKGSVQTSSKPVVIVLRSDAYIDEALLITFPLKISGIENPTIRFGDNAGFVAARTTLEISGCTLTRSEYFAEPRTVPILYSSRSTIKLNGVLLTVKEGGDAVILRGGQFVCTDTAIISEQNAQAVLVRAQQSTITASGCTFSAAGLTALCFDLKNTRAVFTKTSCTVLPHYTGTIAELIKSRIKFEEVQCSYSSPIFELSDAAFTADVASKLEGAESLSLSGFAEMLVEK
jgi:hypothetical protein